MSQENVEIVHQLFDAFARSDIDAFLELCDPDIVLTQTADTETLGIPRQSRGHEGVRGALAAWPEQWDDFHVALSRIVADPGDQVVVATRQTGRGRQSGIEVEGDYVYVFTVRDKITEWRVFDRESEALEATGLSD